jgi:glycosyltransferase involved in cell wall biosynthesis
VTIPSKRCHVLHVLGTAEAAGTGIAGMVRQLSQHLDADEFAVSACFLGSEGPWLATLRAAGVEANHTPWVNPLDLSGAAGFARLLRSRRVDLVHLHYGGRSVRLLARWATGAPLVVHAHGRVRNELDYRPRPVHLPDVDAVIATSRAVAEAVRARRVSVVYPGIASQACTGIGDDLRIGAAGRLVPIKGYETLVAAFASIVPRHPGLRLEIAGEGPTRPSLEAQAADLGVSHDVDFTGWAADLPQSMSRWSVFVQPSREEALGITVLEAMACGLPVVASDVGGLPEVVEQGRTGFLVPPADVGALATALERLIADPALRASLGEAGRVRSADFSDARFARQVEAIYREVLASRDSR